MAINQLSPGVNVREIDITNFVPSVGTSGGAFVGQFSWGPVLDYTIISDATRLAKVFGKPTDSNYVDWYSVSNFLAYTNNCNVIRVVHDNAGVSTAFNAVAKALGAGVNSGLTIKNDSSFSSNYGVSSSYLGLNFAAKYPGQIGNSLQVVLADSSSYASLPANLKKLFDGVPGTSEYAEALGGANDEIHVLVIDKGGLFTGVPGSVLEKYSYLSKASDAKGLDGAPIFYGNVINKTSQYVRYLGSDFASSIVTPGRSVASISTTGAAGSGYVGGAEGVGDIVEFSLPTGGGIAARGRISVATGGAVTTVVITEKGTGYDEGQVVVATAIKKHDGTASAGTGAVLTNIVATLDANSSTAWDIPVLDPSNAAPSSYSVMNSLYSVSLEGGRDGDALDSGDLIAGWDMFQNSEEVDVSILFTGHAGGDVAAPVVNKHVISVIAEGRKDCIVFVSPSRTDVVDQSQENASENVIAARNALNTSSSYASMDSGWKLQYDVFNDKYRWLPLNPDVAGLCAATDNNFDAWWSPAGFTRGKIKNTVAIAFNPNKTLRDELYKNNVNPVVSFKGDGVVLYGDKTLQAKTSAFQFINVRRLFLVLEKAIAKAAKYQLFEFNDQFTQAQFRNMVEPYLREVKGRRGLYDFKVVCDASVNTPEVIDNGEFVASIFLKPARSINFVTLNFVAVRNSVSFDEVAGASA